MATMIVQHDVKDYAVWKKGFDSALAFRKSAGEVAVKIYHDVKDPNKLTIVNTWDTMANAQKFAHSPELKETMEKLGVISVPVISFLTEA